MSQNLKLGRVKIPVIPILLAIPKAIKAVKAEVADNRDSDSPGGEKVTAQEVAEAIAAFMRVLTIEVMDDVLKANKVK